MHDPNDEVMWKRQVELAQAAKEEQNFSRGRRSPALDKMLRRKRSAR